MDWWIGSWMMVAQKTPELAGNVAYDSDNFLTANMPTLKNRSMLFGAKQGNPSSASPLASQSRSSLQFGMGREGGVREGL